MFRQKSTAPIIGASLRVNGQEYIKWHRAGLLERDIEVHNVPTINITAQQYHVIIPHDAPLTPPIRVGRNDVVTLVLRQLSC
jgi:hypothetical protein